jgi:hypothetical protein
MLPAADLAELASVPAADMRSTLSGVRALPATSVPRLADALGVSVADLAGLGPEVVELPGQRAATPAARAVALRLAAAWSRLRGGGAAAARALGVMAWALDGFAGAEFGAEDVVVVLEPMHLAGAARAIGDRVPLREVGRVSALVAVGAVVVVPREISAARA